MTRRPTYEHVQGRVLEDGKALTPTQVAERLAAHKAGAARAKAMRWRETAAVSERFVAELETAIGATRIFNQALAAAPSLDEQRLRLAATKRARKAAARKKGRAPACP